MNSAATSLPQQTETLGEAVRLLKIMANPERLSLLCRLTAGECNVGRLQEELAIQQPTLSQQLAILRREGLVATRRNGKQIHYRISDQRVLGILDTLHQQICTGAEQ